MAIAAELSIAQQGRARRQRGHGGIAVRHLPASDAALRHLEAYRRAMAAEWPVPGLHLMTVVSASDYQLLIVWQHEPAPALVR